MELILSLDCTTTVCSIALHRDGHLVDAELSTEPKAAASQLGIMIQTLLTRNQLNPKNLKSIAVSSGPGSYTGLRIATSTAKGLCFGLNLPLISVNSLVVMTKQVIGMVDGDLYCPMLDARRMEVYCALFNDNLETVHPIEAKVLDGDSYKTELSEKRIVFFGDGSDKFRTITNHKNALFVKSIQPRANELGILATKKYENQDFEDLESFEPYYLKDFMIKSKAK